MGRSEGYLSIQYNQYEMCADISVVNYLFVIGLFELKQIMHKIIFSYNLFDRFLQVPKIN